MKKVEDASEAAFTEALWAWKDIKEEKARAQIWLDSLQEQERRLLPVLRHMLAKEAA